jgi:hypothetical protein
MNSLLRKIEADCFVHEDINVGMVAHERTDWLRDIGRREYREGDLIKQRLEEMIIFTIHDRDINRQFRQVHGRVDAGKAAAEYDYPVAPSNVPSCFCHRSGSSLLITLQVQPITDAIPRGYVQLILFEPPSIYLLSVGCSNFVWVSQAGLVGGA